MQALPSGSAQVEIHKVRAMVALLGTIKPQGGLIQPWRSWPKTPKAPTSATMLYQYGQHFKVNQSERGEDTRSLAADLNAKFKRNYRKMPRRRFLPRQFRRGAGNARNHSSSARKA